MKSLELESYWNWLPTFRVVAERENLQEASSVLHLSASSISRTIRLLETEIDRQLFTRETGRLKLTPSGRDFLESVRRSMRLVDDGAMALREPNRVSPFRLSVPAALSGLIAIPTITYLRRSQPTNESFYLSHDGDSRAVASGMIDLLVVCSPEQPSHDVEVHSLGVVPLGIYCGREHPLWRATDPSLQDLLRQPFITAQSDALEIRCWPPEHRRIVAVDVTDLNMAMEACIASLGLAVLPEAATRDAVSKRVLRNVNMSLVRPAHLYAVRRPLLLAHDRAQTMIDALIRIVGGLVSD